MTKTQTVGQYTVEQKTGRPFPVAVYWGNDSRRNFYTLADALQFCEQSAPLAASASADDYT